MPNFGCRIPLGDRDPAAKIGVYVYAGFEGVLLSRGAGLANAGGSTPALKFGTSPAPLEDILTFGDMSPGDGDVYPTT